MIYVESILGVFMIFCTVVVVCVPVAFGVMYFLTRKVNDS